MVLSRNLMPLIILLVFIVGRLVFDSFWRQFTPFYSYGFELLIILVAYFKYFRPSLLNLTTSKQTLSLTGVSFLFGLMAHKIASSSGIFIPFDFQDYTSIIILIIIAPIIEEFLFRFALWEPLDDLFKDDLTVAFISSFLFSLAHFLAVSFADGDTKIFVAYQTLYTLCLGIFCSWARVYANSLLLPLIIHFAFNLGFYVGHI